MEISAREAKQQAARLTSRLKEFGVDIKRTQALEGVAAVHNFSDWNRFLANLDSKSDTTHATAVTGVKQVDDLPVDHGPHRVLMLRSGDGKTSILSLIFADAIREKKGIPLWIDCNNGTPHHVLPSFALASTTAITARFDAQGRIAALPDIDTDCCAIWVSLYNPEINACSSDDRATRSRAFINLLSLIRTTWPESITERINLALMDEFTALDIEHQGLFETALPQFAGRSTTVVIATQYMAATRATSSPMNFRIVSGRDTLSMTAFKEAIGTTEDLVIADANITLPPSIETTETLVESFAKLVLVNMQREVEVKYRLGSTPRACLVEKMIDEWRVETQRRRNIFLQRSSGNKTAD